LHILDEKLEEKIEVQIDKKTKVYVEKLRKKII
jgi:hypothetical protein